MKKLHNKLFSLLIFTLTFLGLIVFSFPDLTYAQTTRETTLRVALFPYIPDSLEDKYEKLLDRIESEFEDKNPEIDLELKPLNPNEEGFYEINTLTQWLSNSPKEGGYDLVEVDTLLLDDLVKANLAKVLDEPQNTEDWHPVALKAVTINEKIYGIPHLLCGHFLFYYNEKVAQATSVDELSAILNEITPEIPNLAGNLTGSWNLPALYLDAWADTYGVDNINSALSNNLNEKVMKYFGEFAENCQVRDVNPCFTDYSNQDIGANAFIENKVDVFFGYSERLNYILKNGGNSEVKLAPLPLGESNKPLLFTDALVLRQDCDQFCMNAANKFAAYLNAPATQEWILSSKDAERKDAEKNAIPPIPRYLIPATHSAFTDSLKQDIYYQTLEQAIKNGSPYPNSGFPGIRKNLKALLIKKLYPSP